MAIQTFLAMTAEEIHRCSVFPETAGWMSCHFSSHNSGLTNLPQQFVPGSLLILDDSTPIAGHDPQQAAAQLSECVCRTQCCGILLDLQRDYTEEAAAMARHLSVSLPCPVAVSAGFAAALDGPVFLPPLPHHLPLADHIAPWKGREIWLELALDAEAIQLTESGSTLTALPPKSVFPSGHREDKLHCHYQIECFDQYARFTLWRTKEDLEDLIREADSLGITAAVGLYQELCV